MTVTRRHDIISLVIVVAALTAAVVAWLPERIAPSPFYGFTTQAILNEQPIWVGGTNPELLVHAKKCARRDLLTYGSYTWIADKPQRETIPGPVVAAAQAVFFPEGCREDTYSNAVPDGVVRAVARGVTVWHLEGTNVGLDEAKNQPVAVTRWASESFTLTLEKQ